MKSRRVITSVALLLALGFGLSSCSSAAEKLAENVSGADVDIDKDKVSITDKNGNTVSGGEGVTLPDSWPKEVPTFDGKLISTTSNTSDKAVMATWSSPDKSADVYKAFTAKLKAAGFSEVAYEAQNDGGYYFNATGQGYEVNLIVTAESGDGCTVTLTAQRS